MIKSLLTSLKSNGKELHILAVSLHESELPSWLEDSINKVWKELSEYVKDDHQSIYIRDIDFLAIDGKYSGGHCYNRHEVMIAVPKWGGLDKSQLEATLYHELHHLLRHQNAGYGLDLGGAILSEGIATYFEEIKTGWAPPWSRAQVSEEALEVALKEWDNKDYDHSSWFFFGDYGKWVGYTIGYNLAKDLYGSKFNLEDSIEIQPDKFKKLLSSQLSQSPKH